MVIALDNEIVGRDGELAGLASLNLPFERARAPLFVAVKRAEPNLTRVSEELEVGSRAELSARLPGRIS